MNEFKDKVWKQGADWEYVFQKAIHHALRSPLRSLYSNDIVTVRKVIDAAGNHVFSDHHELFGITRQEGQSIRSVFQTYSRYEKDPEFVSYIQFLIDNSMEVFYHEERLKHKSSKPSDAW